MNYRHLILQLLLAIALVANAVGEEVWIVGGLAETAVANCQSVRWRADARLYNLSSAPARIRVIHVSNGGIGGGEAVLEPGASRTATSVGAATESPLWVSKIDVGDAVVEGRLELTNFNPCPPVTGVPEPSSKIRLPVFRELVPARKEQRHLGTDLAGQGARINVAVYNAALLPASTTVTVHLPFCQSQSRLSKTVTLDADTIVQIPFGDVACGGGPTGPTFVTVSVDQPSLSFVSTLASAKLPAASASVSYH